MSKDQFGNKLLYILSEKRSLAWNQFRNYINDLSLENSFPNDQIYPLARSLSSLAYLDIGENKRGATITKVAPPALIELPSIRLTFLLTGARSLELLQIMKNNPKIEFQKTKYSYLPDQIIVRPESIKTLESWLEKTKLQGNRLSDYIKLYKQPVAWNLLEWSGDLKDYEEQLNSHWFNGDESEIKEIFDIENLKFIPFNNEKTLQSLSLVKIFHYESFYKYYLFDFTKEDKVKVNLDWGKFLILKKSTKSVLEYNSQTFELTSFLQLPLILERGLTLLSGAPPRDLSSFSKKQKTQQKKAFVFKNVPYKIAKLVADKLGQELKEIYSSEAV